MTDTREDEVTLNRAKYGDRAARQKSATAPAQPRIPRITRLMALAVKFQDMVDRGEVRDYAELARLGFVTRARLTQIMNLRLLAPDIQERLLFLHGASDATRESRLRKLVMHEHWPDQRKLIRAVGPPVQRPESGAFANQVGHQTRTMRRPPSRPDRSPDGA